MLLVSYDRANELVGGKVELTNYQRVIERYFNSKEFENKCLLLLYMEVGTGKTLTSLACGASGIRSNKFKRIIILSPKSVQDEFVKNLELLYKLPNVGVKDLLKDNIIIMVPYNANNSYLQFKALGNVENSLFIIDEAHLFMKSVIKVALLAGTYNRNIGNCKRIYDTINRLKNKKILLLTGTPATKHPFETVPMFNLAGCDLPNRFDEFNEKYVDDVHLIIKNKKDLQTRLKGLVAYVGSEGNKGKGLIYAKSEPLKVIEVEMSYKQFEKYLKDYELELAEKGYTNKRNEFGIMFGAKSSFHAKTFGDCIYFNENEDRNIVDKFKLDNEHCPKILKMFNDAEKIKGCCVFYFRFVQIYGVEVMVEYLKKNGYKRAESNENVFENKAKRFVIFSGEIPLATRNKWKKLFNDKRNCYGEYIKYLILSPSGSVGITLKNVRYLGIGGCEFQYSVIRQIMGRCNRLNSHKDLPEKDRTIVNNIYLGVKNKKYYKEHEKEINKLCSRVAPDWEEIAPTIERCIYQDAIIDDKLNESFRKCLREISIV